MASGGMRELIPTVARTAVAAGVDGIFMEVPSYPRCPHTCAWHCSCSRALSCAQCPVPVCASLTCWVTPGHPSVEHSFETYGTNLCAFKTCVHYTSCDMYGR